MKIIGTVHTNFPEKFGIPRQSSLVQKLPGYITFEPVYRQPEAFKGLEDYEYIWVLFLFHRSIREGFNATVKPPRLGGNTPMGVFATRSPFRPNNIGLSSVKLTQIEYTKELGPILHILGADMLDNTPIIDIKPYLPYTDAHPTAKAGFADKVFDHKLNVTISDNIKASIDNETISTLECILSEDPRPGYKQNCEDEFGMTYAHYNVRFSVKNNTLTVNSITDLNLQ